MRAIIAGTFVLVSAAWASTLIGNPTVVLDEWNGTPVNTAWLPAPRFVFVLAGGGVVERTGPACDLPVGCTVTAPAGGWERVDLVVPAGMSVVTTNGTVVTDGGVVRFDAEGSPSATDGPDAQALWGAWMALSQ
ncbi:MAG: hypothetical protein ACK4YP_12495 [Myxococcota bacterium]